MGGGTCLTQTVPLLDGYFQSLIDAFYKFSSQRRGPGVQHSQGTEVVFIDNRVFSKKKHDWGHNIGEGDLLILDDGAKLFEIEFGHNGECNAGVHGLVDQTCQACVKSANIDE